MSSGYLVKNGKEPRIIWGQRVTSSLKSSKMVGPIIGNPIGPSGIALPCLSFGRPNKTILRKKYTAADIIDERRTMP